MCRTCRRVLGRREHRPAARGYRSAVTGSAERPILFLDVDGPLIPFGQPAGLSARATASRSKGAGVVGNPLLERLDPTVGTRLMALGCDVVWASTWMDEANEVVAPRIGLPRLPVVRWPEVPVDEGPRGLHWKTRHLVTCAVLPTFVLSGSSVACVRASSGRSGRHGRDNRVATCRAR